LCLDRTYALGMHLKEACLRLGLLYSDPSYGFQVCCACLGNCLLHRLALGGLLRRRRLAVCGAWASW
jgi:hypothetical protein